MRERRRDREETDKERQTEKARGCTGEHSAMTRVNRKKNDS